MTVRRHLLPVLVGTFLIASCAKPKLVLSPEEPETTTVSIRFTGICTLYDPHKDAPWSEPHSPLIMLLPNAEEPYAVMGHGHAHRHVPFILFEQKYRHPSQPLDNLFAAVAKKEKFWRYELRGEEVFLASGTNPQPAKLCYSLAGDPKQEFPTDGDRKSLHWLPRMTHVRGTEISARESFVEEPGAAPLGVPHPDPRLIAARFVIGAGHLAVDRFMSYETNGETGSPILWDFRQRTGESRHRQAMAQELVWRFKIKGSTLTLMSRRFVRPTVKVKLLTFQARCGKIEIEVGNLLPGDILAATRHEHKAKPDVHFALYDRLVSDVDLWTAVIPFPVQDPQAADRAVDGLNCGPNRLP